MSKEKYYVPSIEEFHVGFEYEANPIVANAAHIEGINIDNFLLNPEKYPKVEYGWLGWELITAGGELNLKLIEARMRRNKLRVKHLDRDDIESMGFIMGSFEVTSSKIMLYRGNIQIQIDEEDIAEVQIARYKGLDKIDQLFHGTVRNRSELSVILKQIGVV